MGAVSHPTSKKEPGAFRNHRLSFFPKHLRSLGDDDSGRDFSTAFINFSIVSRENSHFCEWKSSTCLGCYRILNPDPEIRLARNPSHTLLVVLVLLWPTFGRPCLQLPPFMDQGGCKSENFPFSLLKRGCAVDSRVVEVVKEPTELLLPD